MDIGIDLGTTFSVIAVKGQVELAPNCSGKDYLDQMDVTILPTADGNTTIPSVFWWHPDEPDRYVFGYEAKQMAEEGMRPIMFSKRMIGTTQKLVLNGREFSAREVATLFLRYMKEQAELVTGQKVGRAVVTHPAYFSPNMRKETLEAAQDAGLNLTEAQLMMEPCAAALAYTATDPRGEAPGDSLRVMSYDLGGGTFDVAIMEKIEGVIQMRKFQGDPLLGGYNFDRALVQWVLDEIKEKQNKTIPYDENNEEHVGRRARMLLVAEGVKIRLSEQKTSKIQVPVKMDFLVDEHGQRVKFEGRINREQYAKLIEEDIRKTLECCWAALEDAGGGIEVGEDESGHRRVTGLDTILLVGGSTQGQWIADSLAAEFGNVGEPYHPDHCVAAGAAIAAANLAPPPTETERVILSLDYSRDSCLTNVTIAGSVTPCKGSDLQDELCKCLQIYLDAPDGSILGPAGVAEGGRFTFSDVALLDDGEPSEFTIRVCDGEEEIARQQGCIVYRDVDDPVGAGQRISRIDLKMPRPLFLQADRLVSMVEEGASLPAKCKATVHRSFSGPTMNIPILMEMEQVGGIFIDDIPDIAGAGCKVEVDVEVTADNEMRGKVLVYAPNGRTVAKEGSVRIEFPPIVIPELSELIGRFEELKDQLEMAILTAPPQDRARLAGPGRRLVRRITKMIEEQAPDRQELFEAIKELDRIVNPPPDDMDPPRKEFEALLSECRELLAENADNPRLKAYAPQLNRIETAGKDAYVQKNNKKWKQVHEQLRRVHANILNAIVPNLPPIDPKPLPPTPLLKAGAMKQLEDLRAELTTARGARQQEGDQERWEPHCTSISSQIDKMEGDLKKIPDELPPEQAHAQIMCILIPRPELATQIGYIRRGIEVRS